MVAPPPPLPSNGNHNEQICSQDKEEKIPELAEDRTEISRCQLLKRQRNLFDLVALCDLPVDRYAGECWILEEYFVDHHDDYLVSVLSSLTRSLPLPLCALHVSSFVHTVNTANTLLLYSLSPSFLLALWPADRGAQWAEIDRKLEQISEQIIK